MLAAWLKILRSGLSRQEASDRIGGAVGALSLKESLRRLSPYLRRHRRLAFGGAGFVCASTLAGFAPPLVTRFLVDAVIVGRQTDRLAVAVSVLVACLAAEKFMNLAEEYCFGRFERNALFDIQKDLLSRTLKFPKAFFDEQQSGYLTRRLTEDIEGLRFLFSRTMAHAVGSGLRLAGGIGLLIYLEWRIALATLLLLPVLAVVLRFFSRKVLVLSRERMENQAEASGRIQESLSENAAIKAFAIETATRNRIMKLLKRGLALSLEQALVGSLCGALIQSLPGIGRVIALSSGAVLIIEGQWTLGSLIAFQAYMTQVFGPVQFLSSINLQLQRARAALERASALFDILPEDENRGGLRVDALAGDIEFRNVCFAYDGSGPVLDNVCFRIRPGETVAVMGPSGAGKTTLVSLLLRFYRPTSGEIFFDGKPASEYDLTSLRRRLGYVPQPPRLIAGSILDNLRFGNPDATIERLLAAARLAGIHEDVLAFPDGYQTAVGEAGAALSEGQKQRLALARALVTDPDILILDEPTSALDGQTEQMLLKSLWAWRDGRIVILATHRFSTACGCERLLHIDAGRVREETSRCKALASCAKEGFHADSCG